MTERWLDLHALDGGQVYVNMAAVKVVRAEWRGEEMVTLLDDIAVKESVAWCLMESLGRQRFYHDWKPPKTVRR